MTKNQKTLLEYIKWNVSKQDPNADNYGVVSLQVGKYKTFKLRTLKSLVDKKILQYTLGNNHVWKSESKLGMCSECVYFVRMKKK